MKSLVKKLTILGIFIVVLSLSLSNTASAHVTVKPSEAATASYQTFTVSVPNEKDTPTTSVKLLIPEGIQSITPTQKTGWEISIDKDGSRPVSVTWSNGEVGVGLRDEFTFSAKTPDTVTDLQWKAYQTYSDGTVVAWDQTADKGHSDNNSGPFSVTNIVNETDDQTTGDSQQPTNWALYIAVAGLLVGLAAIFLATRK